MTLGPPRILLLPKKITRLKCLIPVLDLQRDPCGLKDQDKFNRKEQTLFDKEPVRKSGETRIKSQPTLPGARRIALL